MKTLEELETQYAKIPQEMKNLRRWIGFKLLQKDGKTTKVPFNAITGQYGSSTDPHSWTSFRVAMLGCVKYHFDGLGFCLGQNPEDNTFISGIDLDNHGEEDFKQIATEFIETLNSYTELSPSGKGIHIIIKGKKPDGRCRKDNIEVYSTGRFFTVTGNVVKPMPVMDREEELADLWEKYLKQEETERYTPVDDDFEGFAFGSSAPRNISSSPVVSLSDDEVLDAIEHSPSANDFFRLFNGDMSAYGDDHSRADAALCQYLAFWTGCDKMQMDRIFRRSKLIREKWDQKRNATNRNGISLSSGTYGSQTIELATSSQRDVYHPSPKEVITTSKTVPIVSGNTENVVNVIQSQTAIVEFDERGDPIIDTTNLIFKHYPLNDTGNAERFYDYFGEYFKYNEDDKSFMFWTGKTWARNMPSCVRKYANKLIEILKSEIFNTRRKLEEAIRQGEESKEDPKKLDELLKAQEKNLQRVSNTNGKNAMISELQALHDIPVKNSNFDRQEELLNTESGVVNLYTGEVYPFDKKYMLSRNTNCGVSFDEPKVWMKFLHDIFKRDNPEETEEIIEVVQMALGESLTGRTNKDRMFILYGNGSNGKSTFIKVFSDCFGDYATSMSSEMLVSKGNTSVQSKEFSLNALAGKRAITTSETAEGQKLDEVYFKQMLSGEKITAQKKFGDSYDFLPTFNPWMSTNNKPIIRATDDGTWRRIYFIPFLNKFKGKDKDVTMPKKLYAERAQILGWMIKGAVKLHNDYKDNIPTPKCLDEALIDYKKELDVIVAFLNDMTVAHPDMEINTQILYREYKNWCKENGEFQYNERRFKAEMPKKGYPVRKDRNEGEVYVGLKLATDNKGFIFGE